jgi:anti-sigma B factor antagonist
MPDANTDLPFIVQPIQGVTIVQFREPSLMDPVILARSGERLNALIDQEHQKKIILDFEIVEYMASQAIGIVLTLHKKSVGIKGQLVVCGCGKRLQELMKITRLDKVLNIKPTQAEALKHLTL